MNKTEKKLIPELRFPEFVKDGEWDIAPLGKLSRQIVEKTKGRKYKLMSITSGIGLVSQIEKFGREIAGNSYRNYYVLKEGDFAYNKSSTKLYAQGEIAMFEDEQIGAVPSSIFTCFRFDQKKIYPTFAKYPFVNNLHGNWLRKFIAVGARAHGAIQINSEDLFSVPFPYTSLPEQQKIASCLSSLDELIAAHNEKLDALKDHKKGLMQNLFPHPSASSGSGAVAEPVEAKVPKFRFPEFEKDGEWVERNLGKIGEFVGGGTPSTSKPEYWDGDIQWYTPTEVKNGTLKPSIRTITEEGLKNSSAKLLPQGTILITTRATIGDAAITSYECTTNQGFQSLIVKKSEVNIFWYYWILQHKIELVRRSSGSTFKEIGKNEIKVIPTLSPKKEEQQKIASCLSAVDDLITAQSEKIEQLQQHKKGLMQGLFPKIV